MKDEKIKEIKISFHWHEKLFIFPLTQPHDSRRPGLLWGSINFFPLSVSLYSGSCRHSGLFQRIAYMALECMLYMSVLPSTFFSCSAIAPVYNPRSACLPATVASRSTVCGFVAQYVHPLSCLVHLFLHQPSCQWSTEHQILGMPESIPPKITHIFVFAFVAFLFSRLFAGAYLADFLTH